ncbi:hypothetical protein H6G17_28325 [Chroococcidiopsis sp. FACHB-1243]|uniref:hypothetical protein n=1 Tax=Chroococcidiopsis sp. [FACHB-1243] TaxID=2692781 RepID=UPI001784D225|nr:hypothetical protein [Chroococcidiopsis sp. [FACHB-1243]]MBD2309365.1 hypothetical protein [Chroococcidiopsis sp. [FACHB-1243]]
MYSQLMAISQNALEDAYYETAYHALCAAMHLANATRDEHRLQALAQVVKTQIDWIDLHAPEHRMSTQGAVERNGTSFYKTLSKQIHAELIIIQQQRRQEQLSKHLPSDGDTLNSPSTEE